MYQSYGMGTEQVDKNALPASNQDLIDFLKSPKNKSSLNVFSNEEEDELHVDSEDHDEVGTQIMVSRANLNPTSPRTFKLREKADRSLIDSDAAASAED